MDSPSLVRSAAAVFAAALVLVLSTPSAQAVPSASFDFTPEEPLTGELVTFASTSTDYTEETWDLDDDGDCDDAAGATAQRAFDTAGRHTVTLCVTDGTDTATSTRKVTVHNRPPVAAFNFAPTTPLLGETIVLISTSSDPDGPIASLQWDLDGDGAFDDASGSSTTVTFATLGGHPIGLRAVDRDGAASTASSTIAVGKRPPKVFAFSPIVRMIGVAHLTGTRVSRLMISAPRDSSVVIRCRGRGCAFHRRVRKTRTELSRRDAASARLVRVVGLRGRLLRPGALVTVRITAPDTIGKLTSFRIRTGKPPRRRDECLMPGSSRTVRCPSG